MLSIKVVHFAQVTSTQERTHIDTQFLSARNGWSGRSVMPKGSAAALVGRKSSSCMIEMICLLLSHGPPKIHACTHIEGSLPMPGGAWAFGPAYLNSILWGSNFKKNDSKYFIFGLHVAINMRITYLFIASRHHAIKSDCKNLGAATKK